MAQSNCPRCGTDLPESGDLAGVCPKCLLSNGPEIIYTQARARTTEEADLAAVQALFPQLQVLSTLGRGGMGVVYKARQPHLDRFVAIKLLAPEIAADPDFATRFLREARALARLNHPNIVGVYDFGEKDGTYFLLMEFVDGASLREVMQRKVMTPAEALAIVPQLCAGLQFAHEQGIVHRDIKPENILLDMDGQVKIADFGLAKLVDGETDNLTRANQVMGTPHYMAPEQINAPRKVDHRADIYSLGVVFYEMLTQELPIGSFPMPSSKVRLDVRLDEVVVRALQQEPERRYQKVSEIRTDVENVSGRPGALSKPATAAAALSGAGEGTRFEWIEKLSRDGVLGVAFTAMGVGVAWVVALFALDNAFGELWILVAYPACFLANAVVQSRALDPKKDDRLVMQGMALSCCVAIIVILTSTHLDSKQLLLQGAAAALLVSGHLFLDRWIWSGRPHILIPAVPLFLAAALLHASGGFHNPSREALHYAIGMIAMMCGASILPALPEFVRAEVPRTTTHGVLRGMAIGLPAVAFYFREYLF